MAKKKNGGLYHFIVTFPDRLYPFKSEIEGQWVRGMRSYNRAIQRHERKYGHGHYGYGVNFYRSIFHVIGSVLIILLSTLIAQDVFGNEGAVYFLLALVVIFIAYQEFFLQRRQYRQLWRKGVLDLVAWTAPIGLYLYFLN